MPCNPIQTHATRSRPQGKRMQFSRSSNLTFHSRPRPSYIAILIRLQHHSTYPDPKYTPNTEGVRSRKRQILRSFHGKRQSGTARNLPVAANICSRPFYNPAPAPVSGGRVSWFISAHSHAAGRLKTYQEFLKFESRMRNEKRWDM